MELRQFTYVKMAADCGSFTKAAEKLFISQPALSNYIGKLEESLGVRLFDRSSTPLRLTYAGEVDFVLLPTWSKYKDISQVTISQEELVVVVAKGYLQEEQVKNRERRIVDWRQLSKLPIITLYREGTYLGEVEQSFLDIAKEAMHMHIRI